MREQYCETLNKLSGFQFSILYTKTRTSYKNTRKKIKKNHLCSLG